MNFTHFTPEQKALTQSIVNKVEHSGCNTDEIVEALAEVTGSLLAYMAPSKAELAEYLDNRLLPYIRRTTLDLHDIKHLND